MPGHIITAAVFFVRYFIRTKSDGVISCFAVGSSLDAITHGPVRCLYHLVAKCWATSGLRSAALGELAAEHLSASIRSNLIICTLAYTARDVRFR